MTFPHPGTCWVRRNSEKHEIQGSFTCFRTQYYCVRKHIKYEIVKLLWSVSLGGGECDKVNISFALSWSLPPNMIRCKNEWNFLSQYYLPLSGWSKKEWPHREVYSACSVLWGGWWEQWRTRRATSNGPRAWLRVKLFRFWRLSSRRRLEERKRCRWGSS